MKYRYTSLASSGDFVARRIPLLKVKLLGQEKRTVTILAMIDSGADICVFNSGYAQALGVDLEQCDRVFVTGVEGSVNDCFRTAVTLEPEGLPSITVPVLFVDSSGVDGLLGQEGFFDHYIILFNRQEDSFEVLPIAPKESTDL